MIKCITLDLDGVYYHKGGLRHFSEFVQKKLGISDDEAHILFYKNDYFRKFQIGKISEEDYWNQIQKHYGKNIDKDLFVSELAKGFLRDEKLFDNMMQLKEKGIKFGICSNTNFSTTKSREINNNLPVNYDFQILSYEVGLKKPDRAIFDIVLQQANCKPEELIYVDDNPNTLPQAKEMGINTHVYESFDKFESYLKDLGL